MGRTQVGEHVAHESQQIQYGSEMVNVRVNLITAFSVEVRGCGEGR